MKLTKAQREQLRLKYDGRCAYCGCQLPERWHADHFEPCIRDLKRVDTSNGGVRLATTTPLRPELDVIENMMPACPPCNISKGSMGLEYWRTWLAGHVTSLNSYHPIYRLAKQYGLIQETGAPVVFYFERVDGALGA
ncbi:HNH endonuclease [Pandoraea apista]|uniref:HNH endonuclease n=1 Tax=Pandoraea apista TaxID=93218 RepID=A0ABX9ZKH3_9BURK|nr:HNH endonuclease signature motif containing protein [Pandoraea apista]PTE00835.1 HNH endonuclease [Pandoraea apista]RRJ30797.1 HNH endonuclease [Pandoraea apista]RRJ74575.1 HNH endonuclease [Pandoraea apista]RSD06389.1 HNH endonuclease [Pandoraea apista]RSD14542.1 HNH endonuclease [Pandoraea apista]